MLKTIFTTMKHIAIVNFTPLLLTLYFIMCDLLGSFQVGHKIELSNLIRHKLPSNDIHHMVILIIMIKINI